MADHDSSEQTDNTSIKAALRREGFDAGVIERYEQWHITGNADLYAAEHDTFDRISATLADEAQSV